MLLSVVGRGSLLAGVLADVGGPVAGGCLLPLNGDLDVDAEHPAEDRGGKTTTDVQTRWVRLCAVSELEDDEGLRIATTPPVSVYRSEDELFCIDDTCTHEDFSLAEGWVDNCVVECTLHMAKFDLRAGRPLWPPVVNAVRVLQVRADGDEILVNLPLTYTLPEGI
ncbi:non-heme iron oxygenase ferredoxin subunit [Streptomyces mirabilis]|uniref:non-heme iron oxygenase ferredoxin subunit n=1 Tax=Streptomyces mirabilis TaxID=68239 RepID=UPI00364E0FFF